MKNKYYRRSRISPKSFEHLVRCFAQDKTATQTAQLTKISVRSINNIFLSLRQRISIELDQQWEVTAKNHQADIKVSRRPIQRPCPLQGQKILVLVLSQYDSYVHLEVVSDARKGKFTLSDRKKMIAINAQDINADLLWQFLDNRLATFRGLSEDTFDFHIKETAYRFNNQTGLYETLLLKLEENPL